MWTISEVKERGKAAFRSNYVACVIVAFLMTIFSGGGSAAGSRVSQEAPQEVQNINPALVAGIMIGVSLWILVGFLIKVFVANALEVGGCAFFKKNIEAGPAPVGMIGTGFQDYGHKFVTLILRDVLLVFWFMLLFIPGIIKSYEYWMVPYIVAENPNINYKRALEISSKTMNGEKAFAFVLGLSFIGWIMLCFLTWGMGTLFLTPYISATFTEYYMYLKDKAISNGYADPSEFTVA